MRPLRPRDFPPPEVVPASPFNHGELEPIQVYDPREDAQKVDKPDTWRLSSNPALIAVHCLRRDNGMTADQFDWSKVAATADECERAAY